MQNIRKGKAGFSTPAVIGGILLIFIILGSFYYASNMRQVIEPEEETVVDNTGDSLKPNENNDAGTEADSSDKTTFSGKVLAGKIAPLLDFDKADYEQAIASDKLVVLYFYASWCPTCRAEFPKMQKVFNDLNTDQVIGFRVNYNDSDTDDYEKELARQFGVPYQHTKIFIKNGERVLKSPESWNEKRYEEEINKLLNN